MNVDGRTVLLTGATGGLGHAIARRLAAAGAHVVLSGRRGEVLADLAGEIGGEIAPADLADRQAVRALAAALKKELGPIPMAGFFAAGEIGPVGGESFLHGYTATVAVFPS